MKGIDLSTERERETFRAQVSVCHQKTVRDEMGSREDADLMFPRPPGILSPKAAMVREISKDIAWKVIARYEWLGTLPTVTNRLFGLFFGDFCGGVACYRVGSVGAGDAVARRYELPQDQIAYLARGACVHWAPKGSAPRLINVSARMLGAQGCQLALAYSDTDAGEIGTVYQASGWDCLGPGSKSDEWVSPSGRVYNTALPRYVIRKNRGRLTWAEAVQGLLDGGWTRQYGNRKLRYVLRVGAGLSNQHLYSIIEQDRVAYPKRA